jgi:DNA-binding NtrC family response regulator
MVVLAPGREIRPEDLPAAIRGEEPQLHLQSGASRLLPVHVGPIARQQAEAGGRELVFIIRSLLELKLQVEDLRRRQDEDRHRHGEWLGEVHFGGPGPGAIAGFGAAAHPGNGSGAGAMALEPPGAAAPPNLVSIAPGTPMAEVERLMIEATLRETAGNRRRAAELLGIGERTLYRKIREYEGEVPEGTPEG